MWSKLRDWLRDSGCLDPQDSELAAQLMSLEYGYDVSERLQLERKEDMKARGLASPDIGDALALTFARPVTMQARSHPRMPQLADTDWNPLTYDQSSRRRGSQLAHGIDWDPLRL
jgi:phage terminase large subunit